MERKRREREREVDKQKGTIYLMTFILFKIEAEFKGAKKWVGNPVSLPQRPVIGLSETGISPAGTQVPDRSFTTYRFWR